MGCDKLTSQKILAICGVSCPCPLEKLRFVYHETIGVVLNVVPTTAHYVVLSYLLLYM